MPEKENVLRLIRSSFTSEEWETLQRNKEFVAAVERATGTKETESVIRVGDSILDKKRSGGRVVQ